MIVANVLRRLICSQTEDYHRKHKVGRWTDYVQVRTGSEVIRINDDVSERARFRVTPPLPSCSVALRVSREGNVGGDFQTLGETVGRAVRQAATIVTSQSGTPRRYLSRRAH
jgi:hypothetical protein